MRKKLNCWEFINCGREKGGLMVSSLGECQVPSEMKFDGLNDGVGAGRACWLSSHSQCVVKNNRMIKSCYNCKFYKRVLYEEKHKKPFKEKIILKKELIDS